MALAGAPGTQLTEVEVVLYQRDHTRQQEPLLAFSQSIRLHADRAQQDIHPLLLIKGSRERDTLFTKFLISTIREMNAILTRLIIIYPQILLIILVVK